MSSRANPCTCAQVSKSAGKGRWFIIPVSPCLLCAVLLAAGVGSGQYVFEPPLHIAPDTFNQYPSAIAMDSHGNPYVVWDKDTRDFHFVCFSKSLDGGQMFLAPILVDSTRKHSRCPVIALDNEDNPHVAWTENEGPPHRVRYSRSTDGGESFLPSFYVHFDPDDEQYVGAVETDREGNPMVVWRTHVKPSPVVEDQVLFSRSYDGGLSFEAPVQVDPVTEYEVFPDMAVDEEDNIYITYAADVPVSHEFIYMVRSTDGGRTFSDRVRVDADSRTSSNNSVTVVPKSGGPWTGEGDVMVVWDEMGGSTKPPAICFRRSTDGGATFGEVVTIIEENGVTPGCPVVAVGLSGNPVVAWIDFWSYELKLSCSSDGGRTFMPAQPVWTESLASDGFTDLVMTESEGLMIVWDRFRALHWPKRQIYFARGKKVIGVEERRTEDGLDAGLGLRQNAPSPFYRSTAIQFTLPTRETVRLDVYDSSGRLVRILVDGVLDAGRHVSIWDRKDDYRRPLPSATYFLKLESGGVTATRKTVLLR